MATTTTRNRPTLHLGKRPTKRPTLHVGMVEQQVEREVQRSEDKVATVTTYRQIWVSPI